MCTFERHAFFVSLVNFGRRYCWKHFGSEKKTAVVGIRGMMQMGMHIFVFRGLFVFAVFSSLVCLYNAYEGV